QDAEYYGTMIVDPAVSSEIPILHWFVEDERRAGQEAGTRASLYFNGEFYDNVYVRQRGGSTRNNSVGKTNFKFDFKGSQFRFDPAYARVEEFNINSTASDKAYIRQPMSFEAYSVMGTPSSISFPMHVQRNGEFYGVFAFIEEPSEEMLEREGLDPNGALYKMRNEFTSAGGNDKKTRREEDNSDLDEFVRGITRQEGEALHNYIFDTVDIPAVLNYLVATVLVHQNDNPHKNHFIYRDTEGSGEWMFLPWDNDLTWGSNWTGNSFLDIIYADMDEIREGPVPSHDLSVIHPSHPFVNNQYHREWNNHWNRLMDAVLNDPTTREMYLRRLRTGMDLFMGAPGTTDSYFDQRLDEHVATMTADATLDYAAWANPWKWGEDQSFQQAIDIIKTEYLEVRRQHLYENHSIDRIGQNDFTVLVEQNAVGKYFVPNDDSLGTTWTSVDFDDAAWQEGQAGFGFDDRDRLSEHIKTVVNPRDTIEDGTSLFVRMPFNVDDAAGVSKLLLQLQYDDGAVIFLNGTEILRLGVADDDALTYNLRPSPRGAGAERFVNLNLDKHAGVLQTGKNVLAIQALNRQSSTSDDLLISPILIEGFFPTVEIAGIPHGQVGNPTIRFDAANYDADPVSGDQDEEYIKLDNPNDAAVDISGWRITGGIEHVFKPGTIIPSNGSIYVSPNVRTFRARETGPSGGQGLFVQGNYEGHLSNLGETLKLLAEDGSEMDTLTTPANPSDLQQFLRVTELHYNRAGLDDSTQFIEVQNISADQTLDLTGVTVSEGPRTPFVLADGTTLAPGAFLVIASDPSALLATHPTLDASSVVGPFDGNLSNQGERIKIDDSSGNTIVEFVYADGDFWPESADGAGSSLVLMDATAISTETYSKHYSWRGSVEFGGSPGSPAALPSPIVINEVVTNNRGDNPAPDAIELANSSTDPVDVSSWFLSDSSDNLLKFQIPNGTIIPPGGYVVFDGTQFNPNPENPGTNDFALSGSNGDDVWLSISDGQGSVLHIVDDVHFGATLVGESFSRWPDAAGRLARTAATIGAENSSPILSSVVITEVQYNSGPLSAAAVLAFDGVEARDLEFVEITNLQSEAVDLSSWRLRGGIDFEFDPGSMVGASQSIVVLPFNPQNPANAYRLDAFVAHYKLDPSVVLVGGYQGRLSDSEDRIELLSAGEVDDGFTPSIHADEVLYDDLAPWPANSDGTGLSLHRVNSAGYGDFAANWAAQEPTPGFYSQVSVRGDYDNDGVLSEADITAFCGGFQQADSRFDLDGDGSVGASDRQLLIFDLFGSTFGDVNFDGFFDSSDLTQVFQVGEYEDGIEDNSTWSEGDWDCDGDFTTRDFVLAFHWQTGGFAAKPRNAVNESAVAAAISPVSSATEKARPSVQDSVKRSDREVRVRELSTQNVDTLFAS
ncbi:MAG: lamin tail domain-containing protein, partial [Planctomycetales bacterium]|nr:lamin tail domain-containing protein [Planctomycetales bacterium]